jgi:hypothetical protein
VVSCCVAEQTQSLEERLAEEAKRLREEAKLLPPGAVREALFAQGATSRNRIAYERVAFVTGASTTKAGVGDQRVVLF